jgi:hypothetical protein
MSEAEYNLLLDTVRTAIEPVPEEEFLPRSWIFDATSKRTMKAMPKAANDNEGAWPLLPFPDGWHAAC